MKKFGFYLLRWQLSFLVMYPVMLVLPIENYAIKLIAANLVGGFVFYQVDKFILGKKNDLPLTKANEKGII